MQDIKMFLKFTGGSLLILLAAVLFSVRSHTYYNNPQPLVERLTVVTTFERPEPVLGGSMDLTEQYLGMQTSLHGNFLQPTVEVRDQ